MQALPILGFADAVRFLLSASIELVGQIRELGWRRRMTASHSHACENLMTMQGARVPTSAPLLRQLMKPGASHNASMPLQPGPTIPKRIY
jgi:hypothetical protein